MCYSLFVKKVFVIVFIDVCLYVSWFNNNIEVFYCFFYMRSNDLVIYLFFLDLWVVLVEYLDDFDVVYDLYWDVIDDRKCGGKKV